MRLNHVVEGNTHPFQDGSDSAGFGQAMRDAQFTESNSWWLQTEPGSDWELTNCEIVLLSRQLRINRVSLSRRLQEVKRNRLLNLPLLRPPPNRIKVLTLMLGIEIHKRLRLIGIPPDLAQQAGVRRAHELLADDV